MVLIEARDGHPTDIESRSRMNCMSLKRWFEIKGLVVVRKRPQRVGKSLFNFNQSRVISVHLDRCRHRPIDTP